MHCPHCQFDGPKGMKFCVECGEALLLACSQCGTDMAVFYKFCGQCGHALQSDDDGTSRVHTPRPTAAAPSRAQASRPGDRAPALPGSSPTEPSVSEGERKQVSVLTCSLVPLTEVKRPLTPDEQHHLLNRFFELAKPEIERFGGLVHRYLTQGFMAFFGVPVAWEDHPHRAVLAALGLVERTRGALGENASAQYGVRIGIDTGDVVMGGVTDMAVGEATERSSAMEQHAQAGDILISSRTARRVQNLVQLEEAVTVQIDGQALQTLRVGAQDNVRQGFAEQLSGASLSPFVGRQHELAVLEQALDLADQSQGQIVALVGEAGLGKSRLLHELFRRIRARQKVSYLRGQCLSHGAGVPYLPWIDMIRKTSSISTGDAPETVAAKLTQSLHQVGTDPSSLPFFLRLLGVEEGTESLAQLEPQAIQARTFAAMRRMLLDAAQHAVVILEIEDLHWIDETSAEFLQSLVELMAAARLLIITTYRPGHRPRWLTKSFASETTLNRLTDADSRQLVAALLARGDIPGEVDETLLQKAEGNPLFLEELTHSLTNGSGDGTAVPDTVQDILMARIDSLPEGQRRLLRTASVLGRRVDRELLEVLWDDEEAIDPWLDELQRRELLYKAPSEDRESYLFQRALTQEVAYGSLLDNRRRTLHGRAATALEQRYGDHLEDVYPQLIYHYPKAGDDAKTVHYLTLFAARAARNYAHAEAAKALRQAFEHVQHTDEDERPRRTVGLLLQLAESLLPLAGFPETLQRFEEHLPTLEDVDDPGLSGRYYFWLAHTHTYLGNQEATRTFAQRSIAAARQAEDEATEGKASYVLGRDGFWSGLFGDGIESSLRAVVLLERTGEVWWQGQAYWVAGFNHYVLGQFDRAIEALERCCHIGQALDDYRLDASWSLGYFYASLGDPERGIEACRQGLERSQDPLNSAVSMGFLGYALLMGDGDVDEVVTMLQEAVDLMAQAGMQQLEGWFGVFLAEALCRVDDLDGAHEMAQRALTATQQAQFGYGQGLAHHTVGRISLQRDQLDDAAVSFAAAMELFESLDVPFEVGKIRLDLATLEATQDRQEAGKSHLEAARDAFTELDLPAYVTRVESVRNTLFGEPPG